MPLDGLFLHFLTNEVSETVTGCRVEKVHQPSKDELVLILRSRQGAGKLLISASSNSPRLLLTENVPDNPKSPPMFCMLLRKHLQGSVITGMRQGGLDRYLYLDFSGTNEVGNKVNFSLCVELMAQHSNIILIDEDNIIVDAVKRIDFTKSELRQILPGLEFTPPISQDKADLLLESPQTALNKVIGNGNMRLSEALLSSLQGFSPLICREISARVAEEDVKVNALTDGELRKLEDEIENIAKILKNNGGVPFLLREKGGKPKDFSFMPVTQYGNALSLEKVSGFSNLLDIFYSQRADMERMRQLAADLFKTLQTAMARAARKLNVRSEELKECANRESLRLKGELLSVNLHRISKGDLFCEVENYYDDNNILRISLDPALSPTENSQKYFKQYRKAKNAEHMLNKLIDEAEQELSYLESAAEALDRAANRAELEEIRRELIQTGFLRQAKKQANKQDKPLPPHEYPCEDGFRILVGRNNLQNDRLTMKTAASADLWFHAQKIPGAHVVILAGGRPVEDSLIERAARIAAYHSKARGSTLVPVDYTPVKNLKKPKGALPGKVIYHVYKTLWVAPAAE